MKQGAQGRRQDGGKKTRRDRQNSRQTECLTSIVRRAWDSAAPYYRTPEGVRSLIKYFPFRILLDYE